MRWLSINALILGSGGILPWLAKMVMCISVFQGRYPDVHDNLPADK
jgi:hypothetical protein